MRLPDGSGFDVCRKLRQMGLRLPILMLTVQREKVELHPSCPSLILTVPGIGYRLAE